MRFVKIRAKRDGGFADARFVDLWVAAALAVGRGKHLARKRNVGDRFGKLSRAGVGDFEDEVEKHRPCAGGIGQKRQIVGAGQPRTGGLGRIRGIIHFDDDHAVTFPVAWNRCLNQLRNPVACLLGRQRSHHGPAPSGPDCRPKQSQGHDDQRSPPSASAGAGVFPSASGLLHKDLV